MSFEGLGEVGTTHQGVDPITSESRTKDWKILGLIVVTFIAACIETDIYLPAFPDMMDYFGTSEEVIQSLLTWNFVGICLSGPFYGPISDSFGRKRPLVLALILFFIGSIMTYFADSFSVLLLGRVLQGLGSGGCFTLGTTIIFDSFTSTKAIEAINNLNTIVPVIMALAPLAGGYLNQNFGFRSNFLAIGIFVGISLLISAFFFEESLPVDKRKPFDLRKIMADFVVVVKHRGFWELTLMISFLFGAYLSFVSGTSLLFVLEMGVDKAIFPYYQASILGSFVLASINCNRAIRIFGLEQVKRYGIILSAIGGLGFGPMAYFFPTDPKLLMGIMLIYGFGCGFIMGPYFSACMELLPEVRGAVAALITSIRLLLTALVVGLSGDMYNKTIYPLAGIVVVCVFISTVLVLRFNHAQKRTAPSLA